MPDAKPMSPSKLLATALCSLSCIGLFVWQAARVTHGFAHWTLESARQTQAAAGQLRATPLQLRDAYGQVQLAFPPQAHANDGTRPVYLVDYFYTRCVTICSVLGNEFQQMQAALAGEPEKSVQLLSISIAPAEDTTAALAKYASRFKASPAHWRVTAPISKAESERHLRELGVVAIPDGQGDYVHNGDIHLIDGTGRLRGIWAYPDWPLAVQAAMHHVPVGHPVP